MFKLICYAILVFCCGCNHYSVNNIGNNHSDDQIFRLDPDIEKEFARFRSEDITWLSLQDLYGVESVISNCNSDPISVEGSEIKNIYHILSQSGYEFNPECVWRIDLVVYDKFSFARLFYETEFVYYLIKYRSLGKWELRGRRVTSVSY